MGPTQKLVLVVAWACAAWRCSGHGRGAAARGVAAVPAAANATAPVAPRRATHFAAGAVARAAAIVAMFPVDTLKTRAQLEAPPPVALAHLYRGVVGSLVGYVPSSALVFGCYEAAKRGLLAVGLGDLGGAALLAAILGDLCGALWLVPSEVLKQRLQARGVPPPEKEKEKKRRRRRA